GYQLSKLAALRCRGALCRGPGRRACSTDHREGAARTDSDYRLVDRRTFRLRLGSSFLCDGTRLRWLLRDRLLHDHVRGAIHRMEEACTGGRLRTRTKASRGRVRAVFAFEILAGFDQTCRWPLDVISPFSFFREPESL